MLFIICFGRTVNQLSLGITSISDNSAYMPNAKCKCRKG